MYFQIFVLLAVLFVTGLHSKAIAQENQEKTTWRVETKDGNVYFGTIESQNQEELRLNTQNLGIITIRVSELQSIEETEGEAAGERAWKNDHQNTHYFFLGNGYGLKQGEGYYQNTLIFFNQASYGFTDNFSLGVGTIPLFLFAGAPTPAWITPKFSIPIKEDMINLSVGGLIGTVLGIEAGTLGVAVGSLTVGSRSRNLTFGIGYGFVEEEISETPIFNVAGLYRVGKRFHLMGETIFFNADGELSGTFNVGGRSAFDNISLDYGLFVPLGGFNDGIFFPIIGVSVPFGRDR
jgi:hypothetical protein